VAGTITYTPNKDFFGTDAFEYTVSDGTAVSPARHGDDLGGERRRRSRGQ
jgi:hypothetical protein